MNTAIVLISMLYETVGIVLEATVVVPRKAPPHCDPEDACSELRLESPGYWESRAVYDCRTRHVGSTWISLWVKVETTKFLDDDLYLDNDALSWEINNALSNHTGPCKTSVVLVDGPASNDTMYVTGNFKSGFCEKIEQQVFSGFNVEGCGLVDDLIQTSRRNLTTNWVKIDRPANEEVSMNFLMVANNKRKYCRNTYPRAWTQSFLENPLVSDEANNDNLRIAHSTPSLI